MHDCSPPAVDLKVRVPRHLYEMALTDLARPHRFAKERVGFFFGRLGNVGTTSPIVLMHRYESIPDERYIDDPTAGARIDGTILRGVMQTLLDRTGADGAFHVHLHDHGGPTWLSEMDWREQPLLIPGFRGCAADAPHGIVVLSQNHGVAHVWLPGEVIPQRAKRIAIVGAPLAVFDGEDSEQAQRAWESRRWLRGGKIDVEDNSREPGLRREGDDKDV